jgi:hypothetical protein
MSRRAQGKDVHAMTPTPRTITIESREHLLSTLAEAAELEHTLMCLYLYAVFSFKRSTEEGLTGEELKAVDHWRTTLLHICTQEMVHLALVANLTTELGGSAHFFGRRFPSGRAAFRQTSSWSWRRLIKRPCSTSCFWSAPKTSRSPTVRPLRRPVTMYVRRPGDA